MPHRASRRDVICDAALDLAAEGGNHALTHRGIDARLELARGSTSYYYRTRQALVSAAIARLTQGSSESFRAALPAEPPRSAEEASALITGQLETLVVDRRRDVLARYALAVDAASEEILRVALASCLFSRPAATTLMDSLGAHDPDGAARDLIVLLEGMVFDLTYGSRALGTDTRFDDHREPVRQAIALWIGALCTR
ncbi:TetR/AcrR family transcriptional regulator [Rhodococcus sp. NPDC060090]|uniref:TetR/AcrR family transcriptional regulator n=1 Tax=Rhodococcus sp. NPDC060090 TaxID=3347056 RepID=UPI003652705A